MNALTRKKDNLFKQPKLGWNRIPPQKMGKLLKKVYFLKSLLDCHICQKIAKLNLKNSKLKENTDR